MARQRRSVVLSQADLLEVVRERLFARWGRGLPEDTEVIAVEVGNCYPIIEVVVSSESFETRPELGDVPMQTEPPRLTDRDLR